MFAAGAVFIVQNANRDQNAALKDQIILLQGEVKDLKIQIDEMKPK